MDVAADFFMAEQKDRFTVIKKIDGVSL